MNQKNNEPLDYELLEKAKAYFFEGIDFFESKAYSKAKHYFQLSLSIVPGRLNVMVNLINTLYKLEENDEAVKLAEEICDLYPSDPAALIEIAQITENNNRFIEAINIYNKILNVDGKCVQAHLKKALIFHLLSNFKEAIISYKQVINLDQNNEFAYNNCGICYIKIGNNKEALRCFNKAININSKYSDAYFNKALLMQENMFFKEAIVNYKTVLSIDSNYKEAHLNLGLIFSEIGNFKQALINYESAIKIDPLYIDALFNKGNLLMENKYLRQSLECYEEVHLLNSEYDYLKGILFYNRMQLSEWTNFDTCLFELIHSIKKNKKTSPCLPIQLLCDSTHIQLMNTLIWVNDKYPIINDNRPISKSRFDEKIRIGYYSSDFREHPVSYLLAELIELHDREKFEIIGFNVGNITHDNLYMRISKAFDKFYEVKFKSDNDIAILSRALNIDIAVDLNGFTSQARTGIFSIRVAPIQMSYIGYLGTMGADYYDYLISDKIIIPKNYQKFYTEKIIYLPSYQVNDSKREISNKIFTKTELGIPDNYFIYCCFNNNFKITPIIYDSWMRILHAVPESVLILFCENSYAKINLQKEAENRGISLNRLIFVGRICRSEYLARCKIADLFLDTFPYNAGTTASDALWVGLPVLTLMGESFASRVAGSLINSIGLPELITNSPIEYEKLAIELAINKSLLINIKSKLTINKKTTQLFDSKLFTKKIETAYKEVYEKYANNLLPEHIYID